MHRLSSHWQWIWFPDQHQMWVDLSVFVFLFFVLLCFPVLWGNFCKFSTLLFFLSIFLCACVCLSICSHRYICLSVLLSCICRPSVDYHSLFSIRLCYSTRFSTIPVQSQLTIRFPSHYFRPLSFPGVQSWMLAWSPSQDPFSTHQMSCFGFAGLFFQTP